MWLSKAASQEKSAPRVLLRFSNEECSLILHFLTAQMHRNASFRTRLSHSF